METVKKWKTLTLGTPITNEMFEAKEIYVSSYASDLLSKMKFGKKQKVDLACVTVSELGFTKAPTTVELFKRISEVGEICPAEVGPALRLAYIDQPKGEWLYIAMEPIPDSVGSPRVFGVRRYGGGGLWLSRAWALPGLRWGLDVRLVFRLRKSSDLETKTLPSDTLPLELEINGTTYRKV